MLAGVKTCSRFSEENNEFDCFQHYNNYNNNRVAQHFPCPSFTDGAKGITELLPITKLNITSDSDPWIDGLNAFQSKIIYYLQFVHSIQTEIV